MKYSNSFSEGSTVFEKSSKTPAFGIDLGTTNSCIAVVGNDGVAKALKLSNGKTTIPSCVMWDSNKGTFIVGEEAYKNKAHKNVIYSVKRLMGSGETVTFSHGKKSLTMTPAEVSAEILKGLIDKVGSEYKPIKDVIITVPAGFDIRQVEDTKLAGELAGLNVIGIMREPTAAALAYRLDKKDGDILMYDLGGGTFDVSLVHLESSKKNDSDLFDMLGIEGEDVPNKDSVTVKDVRGNNHLGGDDLDLLLLKKLYKILREHGCDTTKITREDKENLLLRLERIKKSGDFFSAEMPMNLKLKGNSVFKDSVTLSREDFDDATLKIFKKTKVLIDDLITSSGYNVSSLVLVGGSTKNTTLRELLREAYPQLVMYTHLEPDESVALGAAIQAKRIKFGSEDLEVFDIVNAPIGVLADGMVNVLIERGQSLPYSIQKTFTVNDANAQSVAVDIYEGSGLYPQDNTLLGTIIIDGLRKAEANSLAVKVRLTVTVDGLLSVEVYSDGKFKTVKLQSITNREVPKEDSKKIRILNRFVSKANSLEEPYKSELLTLIEKARKSGDDRDLGAISMYIKELNSNVQNCKEGTSK